MKNKLFSKIDLELIHQITMLLQIALGIFLLTFGVASFYCKELYLICQIIIGLLMFVIAYNNYIFSFINFIIIISNYKH